MNMPPGIHLVVENVAYEPLMVVVRFQDVERYVPMTCAFGMPNRAHTYTSCCDALST